jgi:hypothetical protein
MNEDDKFDESDMLDPQIAAHIYAQCVSASGEMIRQDDGINVCSSKVSPKTYHERTSSQPIVGALAVNPRTTPSLASEVRKPLYRGTEMSVLERSGECETTNGRPGQWVQVRKQASADAESWVFDAYLI